MPPLPHDRRFSPTGLTIAVGAHLLAILAAWSFAAAPAVTPPVTLVAQLIVPEAPPAPVVEPPRPQPAVQPPPKVKPRPRPVPQPVAQPVAREPERVAARAAEAEPSAEPPRAEEPAPASVAASAPSAPVANAPPAAILPRFDADYLDNPVPTYPALSRRMREEGRVMLRVFVEPDGRASRVTVTDGSGSPRLDRAAEEAVARWKFVPARRGDEAVGAWVLVPIVFSLRG